MFDVREYIDPSGRSPFQHWFADIEARAAAKVTAALTRLQQGNVSHVKSVGEGVLELRINYGPGYRVYFGREGARLVILLGGGTKQQQDRDIQTAQALWSVYKVRKKQGV